MVVHTAQAEGVLAGALIRSAVSKHQAVVVVGQCQGGPGWGPVGLVGGGGGQVGAGGGTGPAGHQC